MIPFLFRIREMRFSEIDFGDPFFDSLREDYPLFDEWAARKAGEIAVVAFRGGIAGFLYLKPERKGVFDVNPPIFESMLKMGSFKATGGLMGCHFIDLAFREMDRERLAGIYTTFHPRHERLAAFLSGKNFKRHGVKASEDVWIYRRREIMSLSGFRLFEPFRGAAVFV